MTVVSFFLVPKLRLGTHFSEAPLRLTTDRVSPGRTAPVRSTPAPSASATP